MRYLFLALALLLATCPAVAQNPAVAVWPDSLPAAQAATDTAAAIHRLFVAKRRAYRYVTVGTILAVGTTMTVVATASDTGGSSGNGGYGVGLTGSGDAKRLMIIGIGISSVPVLLAETLFCAGWSRKKERRALESWQRHQLPAFYHRKLKPRYFR